MTKTIKQLYDQGQRQFPMRGGGVSPELIIYGHHFQARQESIQEGRPYQCVGWNFDGTNFDGFHALDLLPEPLPDYEVAQARIKQLEAALNELDDYSLEGWQIHQIIKEVLANGGSNEA